MKQSKKTKYPNKVALWQEMTVETMGGVTSD